MARQPTRAEARVVGQEGEGLRKGQGAVVAQIIDIWINCPSVELADAIAKALLDQRLIAAANRYPEIASSYAWKGGRFSRAEVPLLLRTRAELFEAVTAAVKVAHPYETPSITGTLIDQLSADYAAWVEAATRAASD